MLTFVVEDQPHRAATHFRGKPVRRLAHDAPSHSGVGASGKPGAVHGDTLLVLQPAEHDLAAISPFVAALIVFQGRLARLPAGHADSHPLVSESFLQPFGIMSPACQEPVGLR